MLVAATAFKAAPLPTGPVLPAARSDIVSSSTRNYTMGTDVNKIDPDELQRHLQHTVEKGEEATI
jgi:hypothetical protein